MLKRKKVILKSGKEIECYEAEAKDLEKQGMLGKEKKSKPVTKEKKETIETKAKTISSESFNKG
jgi:hypothetical protein